LQGERNEVAFIAARRPNIWPMAWLCGALEVSCADFHAFLRRGPSNRARLDAELAPKIRARFVASDRAYGSRWGVGWSMKTEMTAQIVADALLMAIWRRGRPTSLRHHPDLGSQYTSERLQKPLADDGVVCSMSRSGDVRDNPAMEPLFWSMKAERIARKVHRSRDNAKADAFDYIERLYDPARRHSTIAYLDPVDRERKVGLP